MFNQMKHAQIGVHFWTQHEEENCVRGAGDTLSVLLSPGQSSRVQFSSVRFASIQSALSADLINIKCVSNVKLFCRPQAQTTTAAAAARWAGRPVGWLVTGVNNNRLQSVALMCLFLCMTNFFLQFSNTLNAVVSFTAPDINSNKYNNSNSHNSNNCSCIACISLRIRNIILCVMRVNFQSLPQPNNNKNNNSILSMLHTDSLNCWLHCHRCSSVSICFM